MSRSRQSTSGILFSLLTTFSGSPLILFAAQIDCVVSDVLVNNPYIIFKVVQVMTTTLGLS